MKNLFTGIILCTACSPLALADELYRQNPVNAIGGYSSQDARNPGGLGWFSEVFDNFPGQSGWTINQVVFWGGYAQVVPGHTQGFSIRFYADDNGAPGALLLFQDVMTFIEDADFEIPGAGFRYATTVDLATPFAVPSTGQYWMSAVAILDRGGTADEPQWGWVQADSVNPPSAKQHFFGLHLEPGVDMSFVLNGTGGGGGITCDLNQDGATDFGDVFFLIDIVGGVESCPTGFECDLNQDGATDFGDVFFLIDIVGGIAQCPS